MPADAPLPVVGVLEGQERQPEFLDRVEAANPEKIFLEDADKAFGDAVALRLPHVRRRILYAQELDFILKIVRDVGDRPNESTGYSVRLRRRSMVRRGISDPNRGLDRTRGNRIPGRDGRTGRDPRLAAGYQQNY